MTSWEDDRIGSALRGENPTVLARLPGSFAVMGDVQWLPGYCVLLVDRPEVPSLLDLDASDRRDFLNSMAILGEAVESTCRSLDPAFRRINLEILGNTDDFLHAHIWPRYDWEPTEHVSKPVWLYPPDFWTRPEHSLGPEHDRLRGAIAAALAPAASLLIDGRSE